MAVLKVFIISLFLSNCSTIQQRNAVYDIALTLDQMNSAYQEKDIDSFMGHISLDYPERDVLKTTVQNDFAGFAESKYTTSVLSVVDKERVYKATILYTRLIVTARLGHLNNSGQTELEFIKTQEGLFQLISMPVPRLYGLISP